MPKRGRRAVNVRTLIFWEWHWWQTLSRMRDGVIGNMDVDAGWVGPSDGYPERPEKMTHPGAIYEWDRKTAREYFSRFEKKIHHSKGVPAEPKLWEALKRAKTATQVRRICSQSRWQRDLDMLYERADEFISALNEDPRYPRKARTKDDHRLLHCARVLAGISCRTPPATAIDKLRKLKHGGVRTCSCADCTNIKQRFLQSVLSDIADGRVPLPRQALAPLDRNCSCTHCSLGASEKSRELVTE